MPNRVGHEAGNGDGIEFWGHSFVADPSGEVLAQASHEDEQTLIASCNLDDVDLARTHWPFLRDRRIDAYQDLTRRLVD